MGRPSNREARRAEILAAFARVLADHGYAGATISAIAFEAGITPGLIHHHFKDKDELLTALFQKLISSFKERVKDYEGDDPLMAYADGALKLDERADVAAARCWVGIFAEAIRNPALFEQMRRYIDVEIGAIRTRSDQAFDPQQAGAVMAYIIGSLVLGAFAPRQTIGFASPGFEALIASFRAPT